MSLSSALNSAMSGLAAAGRASALVSDNIANASTPGYGRRSLERSSDAVTGGVRVVGVQRHHDPALTASRRTADAELAAADARVQFLSGVETLVGSATDTDSIAARLTAFENSLTVAASAPDSQVRLDDVARKASELVTSINSASNGIQNLRTDADDTINRQVDTLNDHLSRIELLNTRIVAAQSSGRDAAALKDQRQVLIDNVNEIVPVNVVARSNDQIGLYSDGGAILLDGSAAELSFEPTRMIIADMSVDSGALSGLRVNGTLVDVSVLKGGALQAQFQIRDDLSVSVQSDLDDLAADLISRFETTGLDPTSTPGMPGLFTDAGDSLDPATITGLSGRLALNDLVRPEVGESWRFRDGLGATAPGMVGNATILQNMSAALEPTNGVPSSADVATGLSADASAQHYSAQSVLGFASASRTEMLRLEQENGVNTDSELQTLMVIEQAYAANARIVQAVDEMMNSLLRL